MRVAAISAIILVSATGCGKESAQLETALRSLQQAETEIDKLSERLVQCKTTIRDLEMKFEQSNFHVDQVPELVRDFKKLKSELDGVTARTSVIGRNGDQVVVNGLIIAGKNGNARCVVSPLGLSISDENGKNVCEIKYDERARAMSASLRGRKQNSVALYAGQDRTAIGAYEAKKDGLVGWAATVTPEGQVTAGRAQ